MFTRNCESRSDAARGGNSASLWFPWHAERRRLALLRLCEHAVLARILPGLGLLEAGSLTSNWILIATISTPGTAGGTSSAASSATASGVVQCRGAQPEN